MRSQGKPIVNKRFMFPEYEKPSLDNPHHSYQKAHCQAVKNKHNACSKQSDCRLFDGIDEHRTCWHAPLLCAAGLVARLSDYTICAFRGRVSSVAAGLLSSNGRP
jgi:hypothetical protein